MGIKPGEFITAYSVNRGVGDELAVEADGNRLVITGPKSAAPIAQQLLQHKPAVLAAIRGQHDAAGVVVGNAGCPFTAA